MMITEVLQSLGDVIISQLLQDCTIWSLINTIHA